MTRPPRLAFCMTCNARERAIIAGRCIVCGNPPDATPPTELDPLTLQPQFRHHHYTTNKENSTP